MIYAAASDHRVTELTRLLGSGRSRRTLLHGQGRGRDAQMEAGPRLQPITYRQAAGRQHWPAVSWTWAVLRKRQKGLVCSNLKFSVSLRVGDLNSKESKVTSVTRAY